ncbi:hypothetical protein GCM10011380_06750 [Sphingomonas metalli]|uniref:Cell envelope biogenesis protein TolA n=1 Tax=Sphingomonas metalli TaxID=1779358 RepID=A0A916WQE6_9SPHN|nr:cell envelope biogenesis protein TolA [Sphingomonas metalli]GGB19854.1 hypothetical protein GCM10011380_06750 [Sphingomonas metalli]
MQRGEKLALGVAVAGHVVLFGLLSVGFLATPNPLKLAPQPIQVSLADDIAIEQTSPNPAAEAAPSVAPEQGPPEDAASPEPTPVEAEPEPAPEPKPAPPAPPQPAPRPQKPAPASSPVPQPRPLPKPQPPAAKPAPAKPAPAKPAPAKPAAAAPAKPAQTSRGTGRDAQATAARPRGSRLGDDFLKGLSDRQTPSRAEAAPAAKMGAQAAADIGSAILRQVQPCANRQVTPGPGAERIRVAINLRLNRDGSLASRPRVVGHTGVDDENRRYVDRVDDLAIATFVGCSPLRGLPDELYDVQNGWSNFTLRYKLPG